MSVKAIAVRGQPYFCASGKKTGVKEMLVDYLRFQVTYLTLKKDEVKGHIVQTLRKLLPEVTIDFPTPSGHLLGISLSTECI